MSHRIDPLPRDATPELEPYFKTFEDRMGFVPNSMLTMQRVPGLVKAAAALGQAVYDPNGRVPMGLKSCMAEISSKVAGCLYCQAHFSTNASRMDIDNEKLEAVWSYERSDLFSDAEKAALDFASAASQVPNAVTDEHFATLRKYWDEEQIVEMLGLIAYVGFLNRWNDSMATPLEDFPGGFATSRFGAQGFHYGKHERQSGE